jgi:hypothetical protein
VTLIPHNGSETTMAKDRAGRIGFANKRAWVHWKFREALEPGLGVQVQLPPDPELLADLCAPTFKLTPRGITVEEKAKIKARLGRSPDKADAVLNAWAYGEPGVQTMWRVTSDPRYGNNGGGKINLSHAGLKRRR